MFCKSGPLIKMPIADRLAWAQGTTEPPERSVISGDTAVATITVALATCWKLLAHVVYQKLIIKLSKNCHKNLLCMLC